jgi:hypothetical protein
MALDPQHLTLLALGARDQELSEASSALTQDLTGNPANDNAIKQELQQISAERFAIAARRAAIVSGGNFTAPDNAAVTSLQSAITNLHQAVIAGANAGQLIGLTTALLQQYGAKSSA